MTSCCPDATQQPQPSTCPPPHSELLRRTQYIPLSSPSALHPAARRCHRLMMRTVLADRCTSQSRTALRSNFRETLRPSTVDGPALVLLEIAPELLIGPAHNYCNGQGKLISSIHEHGKESRASPATTALSPDHERKHSSTIRMET